MYISTNGNNVCERMKQKYNTHWTSIVISFTLKKASFESNRNSPQNQLHDPTQTLSLSFSLLHVGVDWLSCVAVHVFLLDFSAVLLQNAWCKRGSKAKKQTTCKFSPSALCERVCLTDGEHVFQLVTITNSERESESIPNFCVVLVYLFRS